MMRATGACARAISASSASSSSARIEVAVAAEVDADEDRARGAVAVLRDGSDEGRSGVAGRGRVGTALSGRSAVLGSPWKLTARPGTTVEIACL